MKEVWKDINGYNGIFQVSNIGRVKSFNRGSAKILNPSNRGGYEIINLQVNKIKKSHSVHRLVANAFIPNPNNYPEINHKDECKDNNYVGNLEWCDRSYNMSYGTISDKLTKALGTRTQQYNIMGELINTWDSGRQAARTNNLNSVEISKCCRGKLKSYGGYIWKYEEDVINGK